MDDTPLPMTAADAETPPATQPGSKGHSCQVPAVPPVENPSSASGGPVPPVDNPDDSSDEEELVGSGAGPSNANPGDKWDAGSPGKPTRKCLDAYIAFMHAQIAKAIKAK